MRKLILCSKLGIWVKTLLIKVKNIKKKVRIGRGCNIGFGTVFGGCNSISEGVKFAGRIGYGSYIGKKSVLTAQVGKFTCIGPNVQTIYGRHPAERFVSLHPAFFSTAGQAGFTFAKGNKFVENSETVVIGNDVWIGANVLLLGGIRIGDGAVIGAGAVVIKDVAPYTIVGGVPAKKIKERFSEDIGMELQKIKWWDWPLDVLKSNADDFDDAERFVEKFKIEENK